MNYGELIVCYKEWLTNNTVYIKNCSIKLAGRNIALQKGNSKKKYKLLCPPPPGELCFSAEEST